MTGAAIVQVVSVNRGDDDVTEAHLLNRLRNVCRLKRVQRPRLARRDVAEGTGPGADLAHDHHRRVLLGPAFADVRAARFLAHRRQRQGPHQVAGFLVALRRRSLHPDPVRLFWLWRTVGAVRLFRVAKLLCHLLS